MWYFITGIVCLAIGAIVGGLVALAVAAQVIETWIQDGKMTLKKKKKDFIEELEVTG